MAYTLRMRFAGPFQSWGTRSRFDIRDTEVAPSKSGVLGLVCAALGRRREDDIGDLAKLRLGVRLDKEGILKRDYHTAQNVIRADASGTQPTALSERYYLADAVFLVGLEAESPDLLNEIDRALENPYWSLSLGRRAFAPGCPIQLRPPMDPEPIVQDALELALVGCAPLRKLGDNPGQVRYLIEDGSGEQLWFDQPGSTFKEREFAARRVKAVVADWGESWS